VVPDTACRCTQAGADVSIKNNEGHAAGTGIEGDKTIDNYVHVR